jgi:hypothetical protein
LLACQNCYACTLHFQLGFIFLDSMQSQPIMPPIIASRMIFLCRYPLDVIKTRAQLGHANSGFSSIVSTLRTIQQQEGFRTLYRGISAPMSIEPVKRVRHLCRFPQTL